MRTLLATIAILHLAACSSDAGDESISCSLAERQGTYFAEFGTVSGDCGPQSSALLRLDASGELADNCALDAPDTISADQCTAERSVTCVTPDGVISAVTTSTQQTDDGSVITGLMTLTLRDGLTGQTICFGTYRLTATRQ